MECLLSEGGAFIENADKKGQVSNLLASARDINRGPGGSTSSGFSGVHRWTCLIGRSLRSNFEIHNLPHRLPE